MAEPGERLQVPPRPAAQVENRERRLALDVREQRRDVLADIVIARALPEVLGAPVIVIEGPGGDAIQIASLERHIRQKLLRFDSVARHLNRRPRGAAWRPSASRSRSRPRTPGRRAQTTA